MPTTTNYSYDIWMRSDGQWIVTYVRKGSVDSINAVFSTLAEAQAFAVQTLGAVLTQYGPPVVVPVVTPVVPVVPPTPTEVAAGPEPFDWNAFWKPADVPAGGGWGEIFTQTWHEVENVVDVWGSRATSSWGTVELSFSTSGDYVSARGSSW